MFLKDDEYWPFSDEYRDWNWGAISVSMSQNYRLHQFPLLWACVGGEVRGELLIRVDYYPVYPDWLKVTASVKYFEGTSCGTTDLHKRTSPNPYLWGQRGHNYVWNLPTLGDGEGHVGNVVLMSLT